MLLKTFPYYLSFCGKHCTIAQYTLLLKSTGPKKISTHMNPPLTYFFLSAYSNCIAYTMRVKKAMDECVWSLNPICNTCLLFGHGTTENTYSSTYVGDGQFSGRDRGGVIATFMRIELSYYYFCWPTKQNKYMWQSICT